MSITEFLILLLIAGLCGSVAQSVVGYTRGGCLLSIALGLIGAMLGNWVARMVGLHEIFAISVGGQQFPVVWSIIGAVLFLILLSLLRRHSVG